MNRRIFLQTSPAATLTASIHAVEKRAPRILLRNRWQIENIGDGAHPPGMLALLEKFPPDAEITFWPHYHVLPSEEVTLLMNRFPKLRIVEGQLDDAGQPPAEVLTAMDATDFFLPGSGPAIIGWNAIDVFRNRTGRPFGVFGVTCGLCGTPENAILSDAAFVYFRDSGSLEKARQDGIKAPVMEFGPDAVFAIDVSGDARAEAYLTSIGLEKGEFPVCIPKQRIKPMWLHKHKQKTRPFDTKNHARNETIKEHDHAPLIEAITMITRTTSMKVLIGHEDEVELPIGKEWLLNEVNVPWKGITAFSLIALGEALRHDGDALPRAEHERWRERLRKGADFLLGYMTFETGDLNYPLSSPASLAPAAEVLGVDKYLPRAQEFARPGLKARGLPAAIQHTVFRAKSLAAALDAGVSDSPAAVLPSNAADGLREWPEAGLVQFARSGWRGSVTINDIPQSKKRGGQPSGGAPSLLWHQKTGPLRAASMNDYVRYEGANMKKPSSDAEKHGLTPRLKVRSDNKFYSDIHDRRARMESRDQNGQIDVTIHGTLCDAAGAAPAAGPVAFEFRYQIDAGSFAMTARTDAEGVTLEMPVITPAPEAVKLQAHRRIEFGKPGTILAASANGGKLLLESTLRIFNFVPGMEAVRLGVSPAKNEEVTLTLQMR